MSQLLEKCLDTLERAEDKTWLQASAESYAWAWQSHFSLEHDPSQVRGQVNCFRYRPCKGPLLRVEADAEPIAVMQVLFAVHTTGQSLQIRRFLENILPL
jgi:hypothetical protein